MKPGNYRMFFLLAFIIVLVVFAVAITPFNHYYVFIHNRTDSLAAYAKVQDPEFQIKYIHSIHLSEVVESYRVQPDGTLLLTELEYSDFAVGMPSNAGEGEEFVEEDGKYFIRGMSVELPEYRLFVGDIDEALLFSAAGKDYDLKKTLRRGESYTFRVEKLSIMEKIKGVNLNEQ